MGAVLASRTPSSVLLSVTNLCVIKVDVVMSPVVSLPTTPPNAPLVFDSCPAEVYGGQNYRLMPKGSGF